MTASPPAPGSTPIPFDPTAPLREGVTSLEASAGTGKTHAVASLVVAEVAAGRPLEELLVVTFTRKATSTLRERVWQQLSSAVTALAPGTALPSDPLLRHLASGPPEEVAIRQARLHEALSNYDAATIATTHGFCQQVLTGLGTAGDAERDLELVEDVSSMVGEAVDDLFVRRFYDGGAVLFNRDIASRLAEAVIGHPDAMIAPVDLTDDTARLRQRFASTVRQRVIGEKRRTRLVTYDDLLDRLARSIDDPVRGAMVADRLRRRFSMAIVDEFQDTDMVQWRILHAAFGQAPSRLVLVGDPKQAIYAFRGGDVHAYLQATAGAAKLGLDVSWRSDQALLDGLDAIFGGAQLGGPEIRHRPLTARPGAEERRLVGTDVGPPITLRIADRSSGLFGLTPRRLAEKASVRRFIAGDVAAEAVRLLSAGTRIIERDTKGIAGSGRPIGPGDIAVLVRRHADAEAVRDALLNVGVPAIVHGGSSVLASDASAHWLDLLRALEQPNSSLRIRAAARGPFIGWDATKLALATDEDWDQVDERLHDWVAAFQTSGVAGLARRVDVTTNLSARLLSVTGGERVLSDLRHVAELLQERHSSRPSSAGLLARWLGEQRATASRDTEGARRRLESDVPAVEVHTIHGAKGLEFPIVLLPSLWEAAWNNPEAPPLFHDDSGVRCIGVGGSGRLYEEQQAIAAHEQAEEELRLLYVALTRARHQVVLWWATASDARSSPLARLLLGRDERTGTVPDRLARMPEELEIRSAVAALRPLCGDAIVANDVAAVAETSFHSSSTGATALSVAVFDRDFDRYWTRTSYSRLTAAAHDAAQPNPLAGEHGEADERAKLDEPDLSEPAGDPARPAEPVPLADLPAGARFGTLVHEILERTDFAAEDLADVLARSASELGARRLLDGRADTLVAGLVTALTTPLGPLFGGRCLSDIDRGDRLDELGFDLPLAGGDNPLGTVTMDAIADVFAVLPDGDPFRNYHERLRDPLLGARVRGFLTGSIDLVARVDSRYIVVDYKSNRLAAAGEVPTAWHFRTEALTSAMVDAHYPLQAALYLVALHRYLRWRVSGYQPSRHLGGSAYLFLRGMIGAESSGVFPWTPPPTFVIRLSDVLDGAGQ
jgi:exodeoxyribonuclease V beta subunit